MCFNCGDFVDLCFACANPNGGSYEKAAKFYVGMEFCWHLKEQYGHDFAEWRDRYGDEDDEDGEAMT